jgi:predicted RNA binding protein YcfA (HicA-like mRNA interferase family)
MKAVTGKRMAKLAEQKGWTLARINGSHHVFTKEGRIERVVIPIHGNQTLKIGLQRSLMRIIPVVEDEL